jgi:hypothetical protein
MSRNFGGDFVSIQVRVDRKYLEISAEISYPSYVNNAENSAIATRVVLIRIDFNPDPAF